MQQSTKIVFMAIIIVYILTGVCSAQIIGKIYTKEEADKLFGSVVEYVKITPTELKSSISKTENYIMFKILGGGAYILKDGRKPVYPSTAFQIGSEDVYHVYSKSQVLELLNKGAGDTIYLEQRKEVFSITYGAYSLEMGNLCPPICF